MQAHSRNAARVPTAVQVYPPWPYTDADRALVDAILHASEHDLLPLIDHALSLGAQLDHPTVYERNALVIAVRAERHDVLSALVERGAAPPLVPADGVDLLMEACLRGNEDMARALIDVVGITTDYSDAQGRSALHYAVLSGSQGLVRYLLSEEADPDSATLVLDAHDNHHIFGNDYPLTAKEVTPLMMALGLGYDAIAIALLDAGADPNAGGCSPLILAACHDRQAVFAELLARGATLDRCVNWLGNERLDACLFARMPVACLAQVVHMHDFTRDDGSVMSPLGSAVSLQDADMVALLLAFGAPIEHQRPDSTHLTLWEQALPPRQNSSAVLDLLTASSVAVIPVGDLRSTENLLHLIADRIDAPEFLASLGIFTSLLHAATGALQPMAQQHFPSSRQRSLQVAVTLVRTLPDLPAPPPHGLPPNHLLPHESWKHRTAVERYRQCIGLRQAATHLIGECMEQLKASTQRAFLIACIEGCPEQLPPSVHIANQVAALSGAPGPVVNMVRRAWIRAVELEAGWNVAPDSPDASVRFVSKLVRNLLHKALDDDEIGHTPLVDLCLDALHAALPPDTDVLGQFCRDPAAWLSQFEARRAGATDHGAHELQVELALPRSVCDAVWQLWRRSVEQARAEAQLRADQQSRALNRLLALQLPQLVATDHTREFLSSGAQTKLLEWQANMLTPPDATAASRKRAAESEAPGGPPRKEAKN